MWNDLLPPDPVVIGYCHHCGCELYKDEYYYIDEDGHEYCSQCSDDDMLETTWEEQNEEGYLNYIDTLIDEGRLGE